MTRPFLLLFEHLRSRNRIVLIVAGSINPTEDISQGKWANWSFSDTAAFGLLGHESNFLTGEHGARSVKQVLCQLSLCLCQLSLCSAHHVVQHEPGLSLFPCTLGRLLEESSHHLSAGEFTSLRALNTGFSCNRLLSPMFLGLRYCLRNQGISLCKRSSS